MNERIERALADLKAQQQAGEWMPCPRCGRDTMKEPIYPGIVSADQRPPVATGPAGQHSNHSSHHH